MNWIEAAIAVIVRDGKILICQRKHDDVLGGFWEFPGGTREAGESLHACLERELQEELCIRATIFESLKPIEHIYAHGQVRLHPFLCRHEEGEPQLIECQAAQWINPAQLVDFTFPPANESLISEIIQRMSRLANE
jgi:mutator protein MutT